MNLSAADLQFERRKPKARSFSAKAIIYRRTRAPKLEEYLFGFLNPNYEATLLNELFGVRTVVGYTMDEIMDMPIQDRRYYVHLHNKKVEKENAEINGQSTDWGSPADIQAMITQSESVK
jgi:hypothetical protein